MNPLLDQFLSEAREFLESISAKLLELERNPDQTGVMDELFRFVHTLKGNSGLFDLPEMTRVLHAGEDLLDAVRDHRLAFSRALADQLLEAMDFVGLLLDEIGAAPDGKVPDTSAHAADAARIGEALRALMATADTAGTTDTATAATAGGQAAAEAAVAAPTDPPAWDASALPEAVRMTLYRALLDGTAHSLLIYEPDHDCFFSGEDPFFQVTQLPPPLWRRLSTAEPWPNLAELDAYHCVLRFELILALSAEELTEHFRYVLDQVQIEPLSIEALLQPSGRVQDQPLATDFIRTALSQINAHDSEALAQAARTLLELSAADLCIASGLRWLLLVLELEPDHQDRQRALLNAIEQQCFGADGALMTASATERATERTTERGPDGIAESSPDRPGSETSTASPSATAISPEVSQSFRQVIEAQRAILTLRDAPEWLSGRLRSVATSLSNAFASLYAASDSDALEQALAMAVEAKDPTPLQDWLAAQPLPIDAQEEPHPLTTPATASAAANATPDPTNTAPKPSAEDQVHFGRRAEDQPSARTLKVDQVKIDRLMNLVGEMVVAKNALPYLAGRAESVHGVRELAREIKGQYSVINRIAEEMQDAMMQVRLLPVSFVFQRFPRLVRDIARKLGKEVDLVLEGESTEADKNIIEALADPLIHILRNSLDHGLEGPEERERLGKPRVGRLRVSAHPLADRVLIEISDDGRGIDPDVIRRKAYEKGVIDEIALERLNDQEAVNLVFAAGFSTAAEVTNLSGRGVGMDVVRNAIARVNGTIDLRSRVGQGTELRLTLPLSMAVTNVMIIESADQRFGIPMDAVVETLRVPRSRIQTIKHHQAAVLRGRLVPLMALNELLALNVEPIANADDELAVVVARMEQEELGIIVDDCRETVDIILKPMVGVVASIPGYAGSALLGDGSVLLVLNPMELL
ncbi:MAG: chemotaxis protein CheA [Halochromatium sp.]|nr:chemotaxis protein CheA [Halochromatium sp.]